jgi:hypothetical protein
MTKFLSIFNSIFNDAAQPWQLGFQDSAAPGFTGIVTLHNTVAFYLVLITFAVFWTLFSIIYYYNDKRNPIAHKYLTHGSIVEPTYFFKDIKYNNQTINKLWLVTSINWACFFFKKKAFNPTNAESVVRKLHLPTRLFYFVIKRQFYSSCYFLKDEYSSLLPSLNSIKINSHSPVKEALDLEKELKPVAYYNNMHDFKSIIIKDNKNKSGIYKITNKLNGNFYIGSSVNLSRRFTNYFSLSYISKIKSHLTISRALIKYGYSNYELEILEYCEVSNLLIREQYYIDNLKPIYNIAKIAGSTLGIKNLNCKEIILVKLLKVNTLVKIVPCLEDLLI